MRRPLMAAAVVVVALVTAPAAHGAFPGENGRIAFWRGNDLFSVKPDGSDRERLTRFAERGFALPSYSPNGRRIVFYREARSRLGIYEIRSDGTNERRLVKGLDPSYSPGGRRVIFTRFDEGFGDDIWVLNLRTLKKRRLTEGSFTAFHDPVFSPNGRKIAFVLITACLCESSDRDLYIMDSDGTNRRLVTEGADEGAFSDVRDPDFSPDGRRIVFQDGSRIARVNVDGSNLRHLTRAASSPAFSPNGKRIVFSRSRDLWVMNANFSDKRPVTNDHTFDGFPTWGDVVQR